MEDTYLSIEKATEGIYKEKGSKFIALAFPVKDEEDIKEHLESIKKKYYDARHHCYAYRLGKDGEVFRANDDGEPNHSAGDPILGQIRSANITNALVVVVRYFGGTKLGVGGLINAYKTAAAEAIANAKIVTGTLINMIEIRFDYLHMNDVMKLIKDYEAEVKDQNFDITCSIIISIRSSLAEELFARLNSSEQVTAKWKEI